MAPNHSLSQDVNKVSTSDLEFQVISEDWVSDGVEKHCQYRSPVLDSWIKFTVYIPQMTCPDERFPVLFFLPGIGSNEKNFLLKTGYQKHASRYKFIVVGTDIKPDVEMTEMISGKLNPTYSGTWYIDALKEPASRHFQMYSYITKELPDLVLNNFPTNGNFGICGHSMGGHGAILCGLRNPNIFKSISAFAPACNPLAWGQCLIFRKLLGEENKDKWSLYDSCSLARSYSGPFREILVDQGTDDFAINVVCHPSRLIDACKDNPEGGSVISVDLRMHKGFGHSSDLLEAVFEDHFKHHQKYLTISDNQ